MFSIHYNRFIRVINSEITLDLVLLYISESQKKKKKKEQTLKSHSFRNWTKLVLSYVFDSLERTRS